MSSAVASANVATAPAGPVASTVTSAGGVTTGAVVSVTVTVKNPDPVLPWASVAEHVIVVTPTGNVSPDRWSHGAASGPSTASSAVASANVATAPAGLVASTTTSAGGVTTGAVASVTVTVNDAEPGFPCASVAEHVTVVAPRANASPEA